MVSWGKPDENEKCDTAPVVDLSLTREPWRCMGCQALMYNTDRRGHPAPGAPMPKATNEFPKLCSMCSSLYWTISARTYWIDLHRQYLDEQKRRKKQLGDGKDYLS